MSLRDFFKSGGHAPSTLGQHPDPALVFVGADASQVKGLGEMLIAGAGAGNPAMTITPSGYLHTGPEVCIVEADATQAKGLGEMLVAGSGHTRIAGTSYPDANAGQSVFIVGADAAQAKIVGDMLVAGGGNAILADVPYIGVIGGRDGAPSVFIVGAAASQIDAATRKLSLDVQSPPPQTANALFDYFDRTLESDHFRSLLNKAR